MKTSYLAALIDQRIVKGTITFDQDRTTGVHAQELVREDCKRRHGVEVFAVVIDIV